MMTIKKSSLTAFLLASNGRQYNQATYVADIGLCA